MVLWFVIVLNLILDGLNFICWLNINPIDEALNKIEPITLKDKIIENLKDELMKHSYLNLKPPKTTGREMFGEPFTDELLKRYQGENKEDIIATLTWFTAYSIAESYRKFVLPNHQLSEVI